MASWTNPCNAPPIARLGRARRTVRLDSVIAMFRSVTFVRERKGYERGEARKRGWIGFEKQLRCRVGPRVSRADKCRPPLGADVQSRVSQLDQLREDEVFRFMNGGLMPKVLEARQPSSCEQPEIQPSISAHFGLPQIAGPCISISDFLCEFCARSCAVILPEEAVNFGFP